MLNSEGYKIDKDDTFAVEDQLLELDSGDDNILLGTKGTDSRRLIPALRKSQRQGIASK